ncbi:nicotinate phosphoribosyltransferase [Thorsellia kenyensis]|uniref:Nicotinate phosphoribosyltransferase n=1 Tax=Thorsellia kenyensis TaxID=1549888 RepID=A0ABV6CA67_9GAMM
MFPIIKSLIDTDAYKLFMQQAVYHLYPDTVITAEFRCRNNENLGEYVNLIIEQINFLADVHLNEEEYHYLLSLNIFNDEYLTWLKSFRFNPNQIKIANQGGKLILTISGKWVEAILWEVPLLAIISEVAHKAVQTINQNDIILIAKDKLINNLNELVDESTKENIPLTDFQLIEFGTRRRYSFEVQNTIIETLKEFEIENSPNFFSGTSNLFFAFKHNLNAVGTQAHEWFQAHQQLAPSLETSQQFALSQWLKIYPTQLPIALTDCINMDAFLRDFDANFASQFQGLRHDSGDPITWGEKALAHYQQLSINAQNKKLVFSDNLDLTKALSIYRHFLGRIQTSFGIGTRLTCNIPTIKPHNIVIKLTTCNGKPVAKISDEPGKIMCNDTNYIKKLADAFNINV